MLDVFCKKGSEMDITDVLSVEALLLENTATQQQSKISRLLESIKKPVIY